MTINISKDPVEKREQEKYYGFYRAKVVNNKDPDKFGRVIVWIPDIMPMISDLEGIEARPGNTPLGGRNMEDQDSNYYAGSSYIPKIGSWVWVFFENGNPNRPYYWGALDIENTPTVPEVQQGTEYEHKWVVIRTHSGRTFVSSDDPTDERMEITGKKRKLNTPPTGDWDSVYEIDSNQTTILLDEVEGREKVLIRTYKGDYIHVDIDEQELQCYFKNDIKIQTDASFHLTAKDHIRIQSGQNTYIEAQGDLHNHSTNTFTYADSEIHTFAGVGDYTTTGAYISHNTGGPYCVDSGMELLEVGASIPAMSAEQADPETPVGDRDT